MFEKIYPILKQNPLICPRCKTKSIELFSMKNKVIGYEKVLNNHISIDNGVIYKLRCRKCGKDYSIRWIDGLPYIDVDDYGKKKFMVMFNKYNTEDMNNFYDW